MTATDLLLKNNGDYFDLSIVNGKVENDMGYNNALQITATTEARATEDEVSAPINRRGWFGNVFNRQLDRDIGSIVWTFFTLPVTVSNLNKIKAIYQNDFQWLIDQGRADSVQIKGTISPGAYNITIILRINNSIIDTKTFKLWGNTGNGV